METLATPRARRWTRAEYDRLIDFGVFEPGERLELIDGVHGWRYGHVQTLRTPAGIAPLISPTTVILVADLLP